MLVQRRALAPESLAAASQSIANLVMGLPELARAGTVALYVPLPGEIYTAPLTSALSVHGKKIVFPHVVASSLVLVFSPKAEPVLSLSGDMRALASPPHDVVPNEQIDLVIVPGVAFEPTTGARLGRGRGYYDATLQAAPRAFRVGICRDAELLSVLPTETHDVPMNAIVTETRIFRTPHRAVTS